MIPYPPVSGPQPGCLDCDAPLSSETLWCHVNGCNKPFCSKCAWRCAGCNHVICGEHAEIVGTGPHCRECAITWRGHCEERFWQVRTLYLHAKPCDECGGQLEDQSDSFVTRDEDETYECLACGMEVSKRRKRTEALELALKLRYSASREALMPAPEFGYTEGRQVVRVIDARKRSAA
jgi:hypothetical protein